MNLPKNTNEELLLLLGFSHEDAPSLGDIEEARAKMCSVLLVDPLLPDAMLLQVAKKAGYMPGDSAILPSNSAGPISDTERTELANLANSPRKTKTGMQKLSSVSSTNTGMKRFTAHTGEHPIQPNKQSGEHAREKMQSLRDSMRSGAVAGDDEAGGNVLSRIKRWIKSLSGR